jgi:hypothetical protein
LEKLARDKCYIGSISHVVIEEDEKVFNHPLQLIWGATIGNRCMLLPWLIVAMIGIVMVSVL